MLFCFPLLVSIFSLYFGFRWFSLIHFQGNWFFAQLSSLMINLLKKFFIFVIFKFLAFAADSSVQPFPWEPLKTLSLISLNSLLIVPTTVSQLALMIVSSPKMLSLQTMCFAFFVSFMLLYWKQKCCPGKQTLKQILVCLDRHSQSVNLSWCCHGWRKWKYSSWGVSNRCLLSSVHFWAVSSLIVLPSYNLESPYMLSVWGMVGISFRINCLVTDI